METGTMIIFGGVIVAILSLMIYAVLAIFWPEWVGITGRVALDAEKSHREGSVETKNSLLP